VPKFLGNPIEDRVPSPRRATPNPTNYHTHSDSYAVQPAYKVHRVSMEPPAGPQLIKS